MKLLATYVDKKSDIDREIYSGSGWNTIKIYKLGQYVYSIISIIEKYSKYNYIERYITFSHNLIVYECNKFDEIIMHIRKKENIAIYDF
jgi:hypothetical protein